jgi:predicted transcriptional regulator
MTTENPLKIVSAQVDGEQLAALDRIADRFKVTRSVVLRWAIDEYLQRFFLTGRPVEETILPLERQPAETAA